MADVLERPRRPVPPRREPREMLEPLLDDLMRTLGFERAVVLLYDEEHAALVGSFGIGVLDPPLGHPQGGHATLSFRYCWLSA